MYTGFEQTQFFFPNYLIFASFYTNPKRNEFEILVEGDLLSYDKCIDLARHVYVVQEHMVDGWIFCW